MGNRRQAAPEARKGDGMSDGTSIDVRGIQEGLVVRPGDSLVLVVADREISPEEVCDLSDRLREALPGVNVVLVPIAAQLAVCRTESAEA